MSENDGQLPVEVFRAEPAPPPAVWLADWTPEPEPRSWRSLLLAIGLFALTGVSTLAAGAQFAAAYAAGRMLNLDDFYPGYFRPFTEPRLLLTGIPFAVTLLGILLAHELGHFFACRYYRISATYPFFVPAPTLIGTMGAFIRIRSPIVNRRALFDMALAGPLVGFVIAVPALVFSIAHSRVIPAGQAAPLIFGTPLVERLLEALLRPGVPHANLLLDPVGRAAWVGLFATALNLLPAAQLDGGHILYSVTSKYHRRISFAVALALVPLAIWYWPGWGLWAVLLVVIGFRHPPLMDRWQPLDPVRRAGALLALAIFLLCFMPAPFTT